MPTKYQHLSQPQRYQIEALRATGLGPTGIAKVVGVHKSSISREITRNSIAAARPPDKYKAAQAQNFAARRAYRRQKEKSAKDAVHRRIIFLLKAGWSPQQIAEVCKDRGVEMLSTEGIYRWIYEQRKHGTVDLTPFLRRHHRKRRKRRLDKQPRVLIKDRVSIAERPAIVEEGQRDGDLETDLVRCTNGYLLTITDRRSLFNFIAKLPNKEAATIETAIVKTLAPLKQKLFTITSDNGTEFARHKIIAQNLGLKWYFADPYCSQQRGCNENQNGLIRQYFPRKLDLETVTNDYLNFVQLKLNYRPRKKLGYKSPIKYFLTSPVALDG